MRALYTVSMIVLSVLALDIFCFMLWIASGQIPGDGFYFGKFTADFIRLFI